MLRDIRCKAVLEGSDVTCQWFSGWDFFINYYFILIILLMKWSYVCESEAKTEETNTILKKQVWSFLNLNSVVTVYWNVLASPCEEKLIYVDLSSQNINSTTVVVYKLQAKLALRPGLMVLPQVLLLDSYLPGSCALLTVDSSHKKLWNWTAAFIHKVKKIYIVLILFIYHKCR